MKKILISLLILTQLNICMASPQSNRNTGLAISLVGAAVLASGGYNRLRNPNGNNASAELSGTIVGATALIGIGMLIAKSEN